MQKILEESGILRAIDEIAHRNSSKYTFSYYEKEDIAQEIHAKCLSVVPSFSGVSLNDALSFFNVCSINYLKNLQRDNYVRIVPPCLPHGYACSHRPESPRRGCPYWDKEAPKSNPCSLSLYNECKAWKLYQGQVQKMLNAANPITINDEITQRLEYTSPTFDTEESIRQKLPSKLVSSFNKMLAGEKVSTLIRSKIQLIASGVIYGEH